MGSGCLPVGFRRNSCFWAPADLLNLYVVVLSLWKCYISLGGVWYKLHNRCRLCKSKCLWCRLLLEDFSLFLFFSPDGW